MLDEKVKLGTVAWHDVFPWLMILRVFGLATKPSMLMLATAGVLLSPLGWILAEQVLSGPNTPAELQRTVDRNHTWPGQPAGWEHIRSWPGLVPVHEFEFTAPIQQVFVQAVEPFAQLVRTGCSWRELGYYSIGGLWTLLVWGLFGGAMTRIGIVRFGVEEREGTVEAVQFAARRLFSYVVAPLFPFFGILIVLIYVAPFGWMMRWDTGLLIAGVLWGFVLLGGLMAAILLLGLLVGWPLMWGATSAEKMGDVFEANQRCYSYVFGCPLRYLFYAAVALLLGSLGFLLVEYFAEWVIQLSYWAVSWTGTDLRQLLGQPANRPTMSAAAGLSAVSIFNALVLTIASAFRYSFFWTAAAVIYLLMRRDVDMTELDDIYVMRGEQRYDLPSLENDEAGSSSASPAAGQLGSIDAKSNDDRHDSERRDGS